MGGYEYGFLAVSAVLTVVYGKAVDEVENIDIRMKDNKPTQVYCLLCLIQSIFASYEVH